MDEGDISSVAELEEAFKRLGERMLALGDADDAETSKQRAQLYLEAAGYFGYLALVTMPEARNYVVCSVRFDGAEDPMHAAISFEARWHAGRTPDETISDLKKQIGRLENEWREMKAERDEARQVLGALAGVLEARALEENDRCLAAKAGSPEWHYANGCQRGLNEGALTLRRGTVKP